MSRRLIALLVVLIMVLAMAACGQTAQQSQTESSAQNSTEAQTEATTQPPANTLIGENLKYDTSAPVNDNSPITLDLWTYAELGSFWDLAASEYNKVHPNVTIKVTPMPFVDMYKKIPLAARAGGGPDLFQVHNAMESALLPNMEPWDEQIIPRDQLMADFTDIDMHFRYNKIFYIGFGKMTGTMWYNKKIFDEAGITANDLPKTWDELTNLARKLTVRDAKGNITRGGMGVSGLSGVYMLMSNEKGIPLIKANEKAPTLDNPAIKEIYEYLLSWTKGKDAIGSPKFPWDPQALANGQIAMMYGWGFIANYYRLNFPDFEYGVFALPTFDGNTPPAYDRQNYESSMGITKYSKPENKKVAMDFIKYVLANDDVLIKFNETTLTAPTKLSVAGKIDISKNPNLAVVNQMIDRTIFPGTLPDTYWADSNKLNEDIILNNVPVADALKKWQEQMTKDLASINFISTEYLYKYANEMKFD